MRRMVPSAMAGRAGSFMRGSSLLNGKAAARSLPRKRSGPPTEAIDIEGRYDDGRRDDTPAESRDRKRHQDSLMAGWLVDFEYAVFVLGGNGPR